MEHHPKIMTLFAYSGGKRKLNNCKFVAENIYYMDHIVRAGKLQVAGHTSDATRGMKKLITRNDLK